MKRVCVGYTCQIMKIFQLVVHLIEIMCREHFRLPDSRSRSWREVKGHMYIICPPYLLNPLSAYKNV